ncbi:MAG: phosphate starvation-inducible protein PsiF [Bradyrhizobium sp.]|uniref:phosphate starvation-inducible protein PsiF n=1 Tax=Bradyrhizobium sp. TaxID=376 RepID=UPI0023970BF2|nr:phosphate starvation-inducible protein PsiF [Bradyrhizobium sp.]MDE2601863.1 phosphate starvation-inducible protein PsiF [Bradyrhizobium sp.]
MTLSTRALAIAFASALLMSSASAQTTAPTSTPAATMAPAAKKTEKPRTAASLECSKEADAKGLHGKKLRKPFMTQCKKDAKAKEAGAAAK